jgi:hypothetical protein
MQNRVHFFGVAGCSRILIDHARARKRWKRCGGATNVELMEYHALQEATEPDVRALD